MEAQREPQTLLLLPSTTVMQNKKHAILAIDILVMIIFTSDVVKSR
jgi:hypothetical protein